MDFSPFSILTDVSCLSHPCCIVSKRLTHQEEAGQHIGINKCFLRAKNDYDIRAFLMDCFESDFQDWRTGGLVNWGIREQVPGAR
jgi:hypothetical protein